MGAHVAHSEYDILEDVLEHAYCLRSKGEPLNTDTAYNRAICAAVDVVRTFEKRLHVRYEKPAAHEATRRTVATLMCQATDMDEFASWLSYMAKHPHSSRSFLDIVLSENPGAVLRAKRAREVRIRAPREGECRIGREGHAPVVNIADWCLRARYA